VGTHALRVARQGRELRRRLRRGSRLLGLNDLGDEVGAGAVGPIGGRTAVPYLDWATPTLLNTISVQMQNLLAGKTSLSGAINAVKADDADFRKTLTK
jgi:hypothetical protein